MSHVSHVDESCRTCIQGETPIEHLKSKLQQTLDTELTNENWVELVLLKDMPALDDEASIKRCKSVEDSGKEVQDATVVTEFCKEWLSELVMCESRTASAASK